MPKMGIEWRRLVQSMINMLAQMTLLRFVKLLLYPAEKGGKCLVVDDQVCRNFKHTPTIGLSHSWKRNVAMCRIRLIVLAICLLTLTVGCRNRCNNPCGTSGGLFAGGASTIAPPPTYSLNIPSVARNQPYYTPNSGNAGTLSTYGRAPTPATRQAQQGQAGWRASGTDLSNSNGIQNQTQPNSNGNSVLATPTTFVQTGGTVKPNPVNLQAKSVLANNQLAAVNTQAQFGQLAQNGLRTASTTALPGSGQSFTESTNYQTTRVDERNDSTRLAVTDASTVRAPARNFPTGFNTAAPTAGFSNQAPQTFVASNAAFGQQVSPTGYVASPVLVGGQVAYPAGYQVQPYLAQPVIPQIPQFPTSSPPPVLAQSTTVGTSGSGTTAQLGWRDRNLAR